MLEILVSVIITIINVLVSFYVVKKLLCSELKFLNGKTILLLSILTLYTELFKSTGFDLLYAIAAYILMLVIYKMLTKKSLIKVLLTIIIFIILSLIGEVLSMLTYISFIRLFGINMNIGLQLIINFVWAITLIAVLNIKYFQKTLKSFIDKINRKSTTINIIFSILTTTILIILFYEIFKTLEINIQTTIIYSIIITFLFLFTLFLNERDNYEKLSDEYDNLFLYIQTFEEWIETEQLNRHEYKNQLAVLRLLTKEKKVKEKIDEIVQDYINVDSETIDQFKEIPNGGLKGILYYKVTVAKNSKIDLTVDITLDSKNILRKLKEDKVRTLCKLIGIYFDNAIEAALNTKKKRILLEIYEYDEKLNIIISNTFNKKSDLSNKYEKGFSTKGEDRGQGLYFAKKLIKENNCLEENQDIIDDYYIQRLSIKKRDKK